MVSDSCAAASTHYVHITQRPVTAFTVLCFRALLDHRKPDLAGCFAYKQSVGKNVLCASINAAQ